jgi:probable rRNA maturation factor
MVTFEPPRKMADGADPWKAAGLSRSGLNRFLRMAQTAVGVRGEVDVLLAGDRTLRRLNRTFRGKDKATDVLSFPAAGELGESCGGDLAISVDTAGRQAAEHGHSLRDEVRVLLLHGLLHLSGMDHEVDRGEMAEREGLLRKALRLPDGLIARAEGNAGPFGSSNKRTTSKKTRATAKAKSVHAKGAKLKDKLRGVRRKKVAA